MPVKRNRVALGAVKQYQKNVSIRATRSKTNAAAYAKRKAAKEEETK
jgi:hypothetical protein